MANDIPLIDLRPFIGGTVDARAAVGAAVDDALTRFGFMVIANHTANEQVLACAAATGRAFFDLDEAAKLAVRTPADGVPRGYLPFGLVSLANTYGGDAPADIKESYAVGPERLGENRWPPALPGLREDLNACYDELDRVAAVLLEVFAVALKLPDDWFHDKFTGHNSTLRVFNYPAQLSEALPGQLRAGAHTDYGAFTVLLVENEAPGGLQVQTSSGGWEDIDAPSGSLVVNVGDLLMMWTNDRWLSNVHRVLNPPAGLVDGRRQSIAFFANPRQEVLIECIESCTGPDRPRLHPPVTAGEHRMSKVRASAPK